MPLTVLQHNTTPEQAFGSASTLVESSATAVDGAELLGSLFQLSVLAIAMVYIFFIVRYWDFLRYFIISAAGFYQSGRDKAHISPAEQTNIKVVMIVIGILISSLAVVRLCSTSLTGVLPIAGQQSVWAAVGIVALVMSAMVAFQYGATALISAVCERGDIGGAITNLKLLYLAVGFVTVIPFGVVFLLSDGSLATAAGLGMILCMAVALTIFVKETFLFFVSQKISILLWILYLCALEIFPLSLILAPILR